LQAQSASAYLTVMQPSSLSISAAAASRSESGWDGVGLRPEDPRLDLNALELRVRRDKYLAPFPAATSKFSMIRPAIPTLRPTVPALQPTGRGLRPAVPALRPTGRGLRPAIPAFRPTGRGLRPRDPSFRPASSSSRRFHPGLAKCLAPALGGKQAIDDNHQQQLRFVRRADPGLCFVDEVHDSPSSLHIQHLHQIGEIGILDRGARFQVALPHVG